MVSPAQKKKACEYLQKKYKISQRLSSAYLSLCRSTLRYKQRENDDEYWMEKIRTLARKHPRFGYRRITALLKQQGFVVNRKKVYRLWQILAMQVKPRKRRRRKLKVDFHPIQAEYPNHVWSYDFIHDRITDGPQLKILVVLDEFTRELIAVEVGLNIGSERVKKVLTRAYLEYGLPEYIRSDNGPEFLATALRDWLKKGKVGPVYIEPGKPWQNPYIESFNGKFRDECLSQEIFVNLVEARVIVENWRRLYNEVKPHSSLADCTPKEFASKHRNLYKQTGTN